MKLTEILKLMDEESKEGLVNIDDWRIQDAEHLIEMGFNMGDDYRFITDRDPKIEVYRKKETVKEGDASKPTEANYFYVKEANKKTRRFKDFNEVIDYFDSYSQPELDKNK
jgi:hypothetical protein